MQNWFTKGVLFYPINCAMIIIAKIRRGLE